jgi:arabinan endo-1,5-alpha-L-arabinosidase
MFFILLGSLNGIANETIVERDRRLGVKMYHNPLFEPASPDPTQIRGHDGYLYAYGTEHIWNGHFNRRVVITRSRDGATWEYIGDAFTHPPDFNPNGVIWAAQVSYRADQKMYYMYFANVHGKEPTGVGVARCENPYGPFEFVGNVVHGPIDPFYIETNGTRYLMAGSFGGIQLWELADDMKTIISPPERIIGNAFEGSYFIEHDGYFYYIGSSGSCCSGRRSGYHLTVARSRNIKGPYLRRDGVSILKDHTEGSPLLHGGKDIGWVGPGHNGEILKDDLGRYFIVYHGIYWYNDVFPDPQISMTTRRPILMDEIIWDKDGWPTIEDEIPSTTYKVAPYYHDWPK